MAPSLTASLRRLLAALLPCLALLPQAAPVAGDDRAAKVYDLGDAAAAAPRPEGEHGTAPGGAAVPAVMARLVRAFVQPPLRSNEDVQPLGERWLVVLGRAEQHAWVDRFLLAARAQRQEQIVLRAELFAMSELVFQKDVAPALAPREGDAAAATARDATASDATAAAARAILAPGPRTAEFRAALDKHAGIDRLTAPTLVVHPNSQAEVATLGQTAYVRDFALEVAGGSVVADPIVDVVQDGFQLRTAATLLPDGAIGLALEASMSDLKRPIPTFKTTLGAGQEVTIELPKVLSTEVALAVELPKDHVAVFALPALAGKRYLVIVEAACRTGTGPEGR